MSRRDLPDAAESKTAKICNHIQSIAHARLKQPLPQTASRLHGETSWQDEQHIHIEI